MHRFWAARQDALRDVFVIRFDTLLERLLKAVRSGNIGSRTIKGAVG